MIRIFPLVYFLGLYHLDEEGIKVTSCPLDAAYSASFFARK